MRVKQNIGLVLLLAAFLVAALSFVLPKNKEKYLSGAFWTRKTFARPVFNVIIMGDSRVYRGVSPAIIQDLNPELKVLNFAYSNGGLNETMFKAAEKKLDNKASQRYILLGIAANTLSDYTAGNEQYVQELTRPKEEVLERLYLNPFLYWFSATSPEEIIDYFFKKEIKSAYYINEYRSKGYVESEKFPVDTMEAMASYRKDFESYKVNPELLKDLYLQVNEWSQGGITVLAFRPPVTKSMQMLADTLGFYNEDEISENITEAGGHWIDLQANKFSTYDGSHLDRESAAKLSRILGEKIAKTKEQVE